MFSPTETDYSLADTYEAARRTVQKEPGIFSQVKGFFQDPYNEKPLPVTGAGVYRIYQYLEHLKLTSAFSHFEDLFTFR